MRARRWLPLVLALSLAAPAAAQDGCSATSRSPARRRPAEVARETLRSAIKDSIRTELLDVARTAGVAQPAGIVFAQLDRRGGTASRVWSFRSNVADSLSSAVIARHAPLLARWPDRDRLMHFRLDRVDIPDSIAVECMPRVLNGAEFQGEMTRIVMNQAVVSPLTRQITMRVRMLVTRDGEVAYADLTRRSGRVGMDEEVLQAAQRLRFRPARVDEHPVEVWVEQPIVLATP
ncbi:MAG TPA: TonB family protein [Longimicrobium sp.]|nr:TonB family protein [Longimicrobium sp.]